MWNVLIQDGSASGPGALCIVAVHYGDWRPSEVGLRILDTAWWYHLWRMLFIDATPSQPLGVDRDMRV